MGTEEILVNHEHRITKLEGHQPIKKSPVPTPVPVNVPPISKRQRINQAVRKIAYNSSTPYQQIWRTVFSNMNYRYHLNLGVRAKNRKCSKLDIVETLNMEDQLIAELHLISNEYGIHIGDVL